MDFISLIPHLKDEGGHSFSYNRALEETIRLEGFNFFAYVFEGCDITPLPSNWFRYFHKNHKGFEKVFHGLYRTCECWKLLKNHSDRDRIFFIEAFLTPDLFALTLSFCLRAGKKDRLWVLCRYDLLEEPVNRRKNYLFLFSLLRKKLGSRFQLLTDSEIISSSFKTLSMQPMHVLPIISFSELEERTRENMGKKWVFWWPGRPKKGKGLAEIGRLLSSSDPRNHEVEMMMSSSAPFAAPQNGLSVRFVEEVLTKEAYLDFFIQSDVILLPYEGKAYRGNTSGIFVESVKAGKLPIIKDGSWLKGELKKHDLTELIFDWSLPHPVSRILELLHSSRVWEKFEKMQQKYREYHSRESFGDKIFELFLKH